MPNISRWFNYAKARVDSALGQGHRDLDELEAQREAELADRPWLASDRATPTFDEAKARIEWEAEEAARRAGTDPAAQAPQTASPPGDPRPSDGPRAAAAPDAAGGGGAAGSPGATTGPAGGAGPAAPMLSPEERAAAADAASARLELDARQRESAARLDAIREELGIEPPDTGGG